MSEFEEIAEELMAAAEEAHHKEGIKRLKAENRVVGEGCEKVAELSKQGKLAESEMNSLADLLSDALARYTKTDIKQEFQEHYAESGGDGIQFNTLLEDRLDELQVVHSTDAKQGTVWRWHFSDGVKLETEVSKDGKRKHYDWKAFKHDYFDALISLGEGERIADPDPDLRDPEDWQDWIDDLILKHSDPVEHVGPRTEGVRMLRDYIERNLAYTDLSDVRDRQGVWVPAENEEEISADGGADEIRVPSEEIKRICDQVGISTRALQVELEARGLTQPDRNGVSDAAYDDGVRVPYWALTGTIGDPKEIVTETETPAEQVEREQEEREEEGRTALGAVEAESEEEDESGPSPPDTDKDSASDDDTGGAPDYEPGLQGGFGEDPDQEVKDDD